MKATRFSFVLHLHQPVGNFDSVFHEHATEVYIPLLERLTSGGVLPLGLHVSGPLTAWLARHQPRFVDLIRGHVEDGSIELLTSGRYEPVLAALGPSDRSTQLEGMTELLREHFGVTPRTLWLTERVWEDTIVPELVDAGVDTVLVDDWHFRVSGHDPSTLVRPFRTEVGGVGLNVLPISEPLRYLIPFSEAAQIGEHFRDLAEREVPLAVFGDDGEKFGGWPGTREWVWDSGWIEKFVDVVLEAADHGWIELVTPSQAVERTESGGLAYLGSASYAEMEEWTLPPTLAGPFRMLKHHVDEGANHHRLADDADPHARVRGSHWRNFLVRYPEANRLHKKALQLSAMARRQDAAQAIRDAVGRAQSNDPLWHGVFGGIYMKHLRDAAWRSLAEAEAALRQGESLQHETLDLDYDGHAEVWVHSDRFSAVISPARGGALEELLNFDSGVNEADVLTRYREAYHAPAVERWNEWIADNPEQADGQAAEGDNGNGESGSASIHDLETAYMLPSLPPVDSVPRTMIVERILPGPVGADSLEAGSAQALWEAGQPSIGTPVIRKAESGDDERLEVEVTLSLAHSSLSHPVTYTKTHTFDRFGLRDVVFEWSAAAWPEGALWTVEVSQQASQPPEPQPEASVASYPVVTVPRSERGFERIQQGHAYVFQWPISLGSARLSFK